MREEGTSLDARKPFREQEKMLLNSDSEDANKSFYLKDIYKG